MSLLLRVGAHPDNGRKSLTAPISLANVGRDVTFGRPQVDFVCHDGKQKGRSTDIRSLISHEASACGTSCTVFDAAQVMSSDGIGSLAVMDAGLLVGIVTERDIVHAVASGCDMARAPVGDWMTRDPDVLDPDVSIEAAAGWLLAAGYRHLPVVDGGELLGIVSIKDILWAIEESKGGVSG